MPKYHHVNIFYENKLKKDTMNGEVSGQVLHKLSIMLGKAQKEAAQVKPGLIYVATVSIRQYLRHYFQT